MSMLNIVAPAEPRRANGLTQRGFGIYGGFTDSYGAQVGIVQSSAASDDYVWVSIGGGAANRDYDAERAIYGRQAISDGEKIFSSAAAHLNLADAKRLRDELTNWITDIEEQ